MKASFVLAFFMLVTLGAATPGKYQRHSIHIFYVTSYTSIQFCESDYINSSPPCKPQAITMKQLFILMLRVSVKSHY